jgi:predicted secreted protein
MEVFAVTIFMSLAFAVLFAVLFFAERSQRQARSIEQDALLPLDDGQAVSVPATKPEPESPHCPLYDHQRLQDHDRVR